MIKYFQQHTSEALPCWDHYSTEEVENLICTVGVINVLGKTKQLILNFPSEMMEVDDINVYPIRDIAKAHALFELNMDLHKTINHASTQISIEQFESWAKHPSNLFLACEYKNSFAGLFFTVRVKEKVFNKILNFEMKKSEIQESDFALENEVGSKLLLSFYALNQKVGSLLFVRFYAYVIANQKFIHEIGLATASEEVKNTVQNMQLEHFKSQIKVNIEIDTYRQSLHKVLASEYVIRMVFSE
jgi:hypothetical protein